MEKIQKIIDDICKHHNIEYLYVTKTGSHLYGTYSETSDSDYKVIFKESTDNLILDRRIKTINYTTGDDKSKNTVDDIDIQFWSLGYWLELLKKSETNSIDVLFSYKTSAMLFCRDEIKIFMENPTKMFDSNNLRTFLGFATSELLKYDIKISNIKSIKLLLDFLNKFKFEEDDKLEKYADEIILLDSNFKIEHSENEGQSYKHLHICGVDHNIQIKIEEFYNRILKKYNEYGTRTKKALEEGRDYKTISNAMRMLIEIEEIVEKGKIDFPLKDAEYIKKIKRNDNIDIEQIKDEISNKYETVKHKLENQIDQKCKRDNKFIDTHFLKLYK